MKRRVAGFTIIELLIVLVVLAILGAVVVPHMMGFLNRSSREAWDADRKTLETAVDGWRTDTTQRAGDQWPIIAGGSDRTCLQPGPNTVAPCNTYIDFATLVNDGYLKDMGQILSADTSKNTTANNPRSGSYGWYVNDLGLVASDPTYAESVGYP